MIPPWSWKEDTRNPQKLAQMTPILTLSGTDIYASPFSLRCLYHASNYSLILTPWLQQHRSQTDTHWGTWTLPSPSDFEFRIWTQTLLKASEGKRWCQSDMCWLLNLPLDLWSEFWSMTKRKFPSFTHFKDCSEILPCSVSQKKQTDLMSRLLHPIVAPHPQRSASPCTTWIDSHFLLPKVVFFLIFVNLGLHLPAKVLTLVSFL